MAAFPPSKQALGIGAKLAVVQSVPLVAVVLIVGGQAVLPAAMGFLTVAVVPYCTRRQAAGFVVALAVVGAVSSLVAGTAWAVLVMVLVCLGAGMASRVSVGLFGIAPVTAAVLSLYPMSISPLVVGMVILAVGTYAAVAVHFMKFHVDPTPVSWQVAMRHASVQAVACGVTTAVALYYDLPRAYWLVMTLALVLVPYRGDSLVRSRQRIVGTVFGALIAVLLSPLPRPWQLLFAVVCMTLMFTYLVTKNYVLQVTFLTPMIVFLISSGAVTDTLSLDWLRLLYTAVACLAGGLLALALARDDEGLPA